MFYYFAYGSNMNPARVEYRGLRVEDYEGGVLHDYELAFNKRSVKHKGAASANVMAIQGGRVEGVIYKLGAPGQNEIM
ncbi:MAG: gamma-glutamylcyclotransferase, partial [Pseudomonadales bacterium]|nr:gamma-glutamylcyclotransferase [Pseudomonadales bacterium]